MSTVHPQLSGFINNSLYVSPEVIHADLKRIYKNETINLADIIEWCARVETLHLADIDNMFYFEAEEFIIEHGMVLLPCNLHRLLDVYTDPNTSNSIIHTIGNNGQFLFGFPENMRDGDTVYLNYISIPVTEDGTPLVQKTHEEAVGFFCRCRMFEEKMNNGEMSPQLWMMWDQKFTASCTAAKQDMRSMKRNDYNDLVKIRGMMIKRLGQTVLRNNLYYNI